MPTSTHEILLSRYLYDPLDRLINSTPCEQSAIQRYYCNTRVATEIQSSVQRSIVQHDDQVLAQQQREEDRVVATLLATDQQRSILNALSANQTHPLTYSPYGHRPPENGLFSLLGFNGERPDPVTGHYHLGNGYRQFNPVLMRFNSPDSWSPFGEGGINTYGYCNGDPRNLTDPNGHAPGWLLSIARNLGFRNSKKYRLAAEAINEGKFKVPKPIISAKNFPPNEFPPTTIDPAKDILSIANFKGNKVYVYHDVKTQTVDYLSQHPVSVRKKKNTLNVIFGEERITQIRATDNTGYYAAREIKQLNRKAETGYLSAKNVRDPEYRSYLLKKNVGQGID
ncbi:RHS repeat-associated core domain-containing protein [Pseudomonas fluorescens]|uniref:Teneurin-like YD-shell domain-containing protein n=1 Tax=Pseudomonas fluorescens TaxID=294 RepID=A0A5E7D2I0_PSEFL|nr:RHS repeat-associated core domain-containing protein [Pseudomonas fluorescens]VVO06025.1 hypothetical protein PS710_03061 [Pseudomonas fluorescens]